MAAEDEMFAILRRWNIYDGTLKTNRWLRLNNHWISGFFLNVVLTKYSHVALGVMPQCVFSAALNWNKGMLIYELPCFPFQPAVWLKCFRCTHGKDSGVHSKMLMTVHSLGFLKRQSMLILDELRKDCKSWSPGFMWIQKIHFFSAQNIYIFPSDLTDEDLSGQTHTQPEGATEPEEKSCKLETVPAHGSQVTIVGEVLSNTQLVLRRGGALLCMLVILVVGVLINEVVTGRLRWTSVLGTRGAAAAWWLGSRA